MDRLVLTLTVLFLLGAGGALAGWSGSADTAPADRVAVTRTEDPSGWRRTARGWEHESTWKSLEPQELAPALRVHPVLVATLQVMMVLGALVLFEKPR